MSWKFSTAKVHTAIVLREIFTTTVRNTFPNEMENKFENMRRCLLESSRNVCNLPMYAAGEETLSLRTRKRITPRDAGSLRRIASLYGGRGANPTIQTPLARITTRHNYRGKATGSHKCD